MASKQKATSPEESERGHLRQESEKRTGISEAGRKWIEENAEAIRSSNEYVDKHGLPLAKYRRF